MSRYLAPLVSLGILAAIVAAPTQSFAASNNKVAVTSAKIAINKVALKKHHHRRHRRARRHIVIRRRK